MLCLPQDINLLRSLIQRHVKYTESDVGKRILANWDKASIFGWLVGGSCPWPCCFGGCSRCLPAHAP